MKTIDAMKQARHCLFGYKAGCKMDAEAVQQLIDNLDAAVAREEAQTVEPVYLECVDGYWCSISKKRYDALSNDRRWLLFDQPAPPPSSEREALIECLRFHQSLSSGKNSVYQKAADALQASESVAVERDELRAKLAALEGQEPSAWMQSSPYVGECIAGSEFLVMTDAWKKHLLNDPENTDFVASHNVPLYLASGAAQPVSAVVPEGWKLVPVEPTQEMLEASPNAWEADAKVTYRSMLAAAPHPPAPSAKPLPLTDEQIDSACSDILGRCGIYPSANTKRVIARAIEAAHGITQEPTT